MYYTVYSSGKRRSLPLTMIYLMLTYILNQTRPTLEEQKILNLLLQTTCLYDLSCNLKNKVLRNRDM